MHCAAPVPVWLSGGTGGHGASPTPVRWCRAADSATFLHLDLAVENGTGGLAPARPLTWQVEYPGQDPEAQKDKLVWEIQVSERDVRALVPLVQVGAPPTPAPHPTPVGPRAQPCSAP